MSRNRAPDKSELREAAFRSLARREHSVFELRSKLIRLGGSESAVTAVIGGLKDAKLLSDRRFAEQYCSSRINRGYGPLGIRYDLQQHRLDDELISSVMAPYDEMWPEILENLRRRRFGQAYPESYSEWAKQAYFLQRRGFPGGLIKSVLRKAY